MADDIEQPPRGYNTEDVKAVAEPEPAPPPRRRSRWKLFVVALVLVPALAFALWTWVALNWSYSEGHRPGFVQKISRKGWLCKTWEGELAQSAVPGSMPSVFYFSVRDDSVAHQINALSGKLVSLRYQEHRGIPTSCFGETNHFVTGVRVLQ
jgi:hypothetical protein